MKFENIVSCILVFLTSYNNAENCQHGIFTIQRGHQCVVSQENIISNKSVEQHICKSECIQRRKCLFLNYNRVKGRCILGKRACIRLEPEVQSDMAFFGTKSALCLKWIPSETNLNGMLACGDDSCSSHVGRALKDSHLLPGDVSAGLLYTMLNGREYELEPMEHLDVLFGCQATWVPFTAGDVLPHQAVVGGYLSSGSGKPLYIVKRAFSNTYSHGYYDPVSKKGYIEFMGPNEVTHMEMLLLI